MDETVRDAVFGNVGSIITFRVGAEDAELLEKELAPEFMATDIVNLGKRQIYLKLMIDGVASKAFSAYTMDTLPILQVSNREKIIAQSRATYAKSRTEVEQAIVDWHSPVESALQRALKSSESENRRIPQPLLQPVQSQIQPKLEPLSLGEAIKRGPVDFRGRRLSPNDVRHKPKQPNDLESLRHQLEESVGGNKSTHE